MRCLVLGYSFEPRPESPALGTTGSVVTSGLSINGCSHPENRYNDREQKMTGPEIRALATSKARHDSNRASFSSSDLGDVTRNNLQRRFLAEHRVAILEQCCNVVLR